MVCATTSLSNYVLTHSFLAKVLWQFARKQRCLIKTFGVLADGFEERPVIKTKILPELNWVVIVHDEEPPKFFRDDSWVNLGGVDGRVEDKSCCMDRVSDDNNFWYTR